MRQVLMFTSMCALVACNPQPAPQTGALALGPAAQGHGAYAFRVQGDQATLLDRDGATIGSITIAPADALNVRVDLALGPTHEVAETERSSVEQQLGIVVLPASPL